MSRLLWPPNIDAHLSGNGRRPYERLSARMVKFGKIIKKKLDLRFDVVATKYIKSISEIPGGFIRPLNDRGRKMTICMAMAEARREGRDIAITVEDNPCTPMSVAQGWTKVSTPALLKSQQMNQWQKNAFATYREGVKRLWLGGWMAQTPFNRLLGHKGVLFFPLSRTLLFLTQWLLTVIPFR